MAYTVASRPVPEGEAWARSALARLGQVPGVHRAGLALVEGGGRRLLFTASDRDNERSLEWCEVDAYEEVPLNHTVRTGEAVVGSLDGLAGRYRGFVDRQTLKTHAIAAFPIFAAGHVQGGYALFFDTPQRFDQAQLTELEALGARLGLDLRRLQRATTHASRSLAAEPVPHGARAATYAVAADRGAVAQARHFVMRTLTGWGIEAETVDNAVLCLSELVTNAIIHTDSGCELRVMLKGGVITATVRDGGSTVVVDPINVAKDPLAVRGRGLGCGGVVDSVGLGSGRRRNDRMVRARAGEMTRLVDQSLNCPPFGERMLCVLPAASAAAFCVSRIFAQGPYAALTRPSAQRSGMMCRSQRVLAGSAWTRERNATLPSCGSEHGPWRPGGPPITSGSWLRKSAICGCSPKSARACSCLGCGVTLGRNTWRRDDIGQPS